MKSRSLRILAYLFPLVWLSGATLIINYGIGVFSSGVADIHSRASQTGTIDSSTLVMHSAEAREFALGVIGLGLFVGCIGLAVPVFVHFAGSAMPRHARLCAEVLRYVALAALLLTLVGLFPPWRLRGVGMLSVAVLSLAWIALVRGQVLPRWTLLALWLLIIGGIPIGMQFGPLAALAPLAGALGIAGTALLTQAFTDPASRAPTLSRARRSAS